MREESLRWGFIFGAAAALLGAFSLLLGTLIAPIPLVSTNEAVAFAVFIRGMLVLLALAVALSLSYIAGLRAERERLAIVGAALNGEPDATSRHASASGQTAQRFGGAIAGAIVLLFYVAGTTLYGLAFPLAAGVKSDTSLGSIEGRVIYGLAIVLLGAGMGSLGARSVVAKLLMSQILATAAPTPPSPPIIPPAPTVPPTSPPPSPPEHAASSAPPPAPTDAALASSPSTPE